MTLIKKGFLFEILFLYSIQPAKNQAEYIYLFEIPQT